MNLFLVRHGIAAETSGSAGARDAERPLSDKGVVRTREAAAGFARLEPGVARIVSSPLVRAVQTAEIFAKALRFEGRVERARELRAEAEAADVASWLRGEAPCDVMLVGHMPSLGALTAILACGREEMAFPLKKASVCMLSFVDGFLPGTGTIEWYLPPGVLARLAGR